MRLTSTTLSVVGVAVVHIQIHTAADLFLVCGTYALYTTWFWFTTYLCTRLRFVTWLAGIMGEFKILSFARIKWTAQKTSFMALICDFLFCVFFNDFCNNQGRIWEQFAFLHNVHARQFLTVFVLFLWRLSFRHFF